MKLSFLIGYFPNELKITKVIPIYKNDDSKFISNRPVSILPVFSKIFEHLMYNRLLSFVNKYSIFYNYQIGFQKNYNTTMALIMLVDKILNAIDKGDFVLGIFLDLSKAFDTTDHRILFNKLYKYGIYS